jgi:hypothetical protein
VKRSVHWRMGVCACVTVLRAHADGAVGAHSFSLCSPRSSETWPRFRWAVAVHVASYETCCETCSLLGMTVVIGSHWTTMGCQTNAYACA